MNSTFLLRVSLWIDIVKDDEPRSLSKWTVSFQSVKVADKLIINELELKDVHRQKFETFIFKDQHEKT